jgi:alkanesulfonate monooxygenase SsuD/methylene tetrahydromethanopterin reductase-like flavin-dependent oxidoreductase (luciferase family)
MRVGVLVLPIDPWAQTVERVQRLEALGYDHVWTYDHLSWRRYREHDWHATIPWLTGVAAATDRLRIGTMVTSPNFRHPVTLAKDAMTLDHISGGRLTLGIGAGGIGFDSTVLGDETLPVGARIDRFVEFVEVVDALLREPRVSHRGQYYIVDDARMLPGCVQQPRVPIAIAAGGGRTLALVARHADAWITYGDTSYADVSPEGTETIVRKQLERLEDACAELGRDPGEIDRIYLAGNTEARPLGSPEAFAAFVARYTELGFTDVVFHHPVPGDPVWTEPEAIVEQIATEVLPHLR